MEMKKKAVEEILAEHNLKILKKLHYDEIVEFVFDNIKRKNLSTSIYFLQMAIYFILLIVFSIVFLHGKDLLWGPFFKYLGYGIFCGAILVVPVHELIHACAYKLAGAPKISFGMDMKQMIFYVTADRYPVGRNKFYFVAMAPFVFLNLTSLWIMFMHSSPGLSICGLTFLFLHNIMCIGDFAMISFFSFHRKKELYTFDILEQKLSFICERI